MKKIIIIFIAAAMFCGCASADKSGRTGGVPIMQYNSPIPSEFNARQDIDSKTDKPQAADDGKAGAYVPLNFETQRAVWITYIELNEMLSDGEENYRSRIERAFDNISSLGCNTVYFHARAFGDAYYDSRLYTANELICGQDGRAEYDPLSIAVKAAHERGLSLHAWINPLRCADDRRMELMQGTLYEWYCGGEYMWRDENGIYWLDPAYEQVRSLIADGAAEIALNYDVDGIHIDDYFYPTTDESFDKSSYAAYGGGLPLNEWRMKNCSDMVGEMYSAVKTADSRILFGVSPAGNLLNDREKLFADVEKWCTEDGYLDYVAPQIYFSYDNAVCPFAQTLAQWQDIAADKTMVCGLAVYKLEDGGEFEGQTDIIARQIADLDGGGYALYSYRSLFESSAGDPVCAYISEQSGGASDTEINF